MMRRLRSTPAAVGAAVLAAAALPVALALGGDDAAPAASTADGAGRALATVERRTLTAREQVTGALGYGEPVSTVATASGTITWLPAEGARIRRDEPLYRVDEQPVRLFYGRLPAYRDLTVGDEGADVEQLERNLRALGHDAGGALEVDETFDAATAAAVRDWQDAHDLAETGTMRRGDVAVLPGPRRVSRRTAEVGSPARPGAAVLETTGTRRLVTVDLDTTKQALVRRGDTVTVGLPDGREARGRITEVGRVARKSGDEGEDSTTIPVTIRLTGARAARRFDEAPVMVGIARQQRRSVLAVPVTALVALPGGRYAVEVVERGGTRRVPVDPGVFADGLVEVRGSGLRPGQRVRVPA